MDNRLTAERRERLGQHVRAVWLRWARDQPNPKPSWLLPWEELSESDREVDRRIGAILWGDGVADMTELLAKAELERAEDKATIERLQGKLLKSTDGVFLGGGDKVWLVGRLTYENGAIVSTNAVGYRLQLIWEGGGEFVGTVYSTREAVEAGDKPGQDQQD